MLEQKRRNPIRCEAAQREQRKVNFTSCEVERQSHSQGVSEREHVLLRCEDSQLLEAQTSSPDGEVVRSIVGLQEERGRRRFENLKLPRIL